MTDDHDSETHARGGIQALDAALQLLLAMGTFRGPVALSDLARAANMPVSKAHRYLASFLHAGLATQAGRSGRYDLGPAAAQLGLAALQRNDFINGAADRLGELSAETGLAALLSVWGPHGAVVIRMERGASYLVTSLGLGSSLPLLNSASGRVFLSFLPAARTKTVLDVELAQAKASGMVLPDCDLTPKGLEAMKTRIRDEQLATIDGRFIPGLHAVAAPILDWQGEAAVVATLIGNQPDSAEADAAPARALRRFAQSLSIR